ncbi:hypothetical protein [Caulobacter sp. NIBR1757]|uniref:hypothetical protein n=1 Tax=Caulobacter sp. NIBR1757 TaxID=3016000 RepID=UPI0022F08E00|nr:hypothetical protein [Caulobacter sp. NIBR1757]
MSTDLKNSIFLWVGAIVAAGLFWAALQVDVSRFIPPKLLFPLVCGVAVLNILNGVWRFWRHRNARKS